MCSAMFGANVVVMPRRTHILNPGEWMVCHAPAIVETLLGSCVSIVLWSGERRLGGMCHFVLPATSALTFDARYGDAALKLMLRRFHAEGIATGNCVAKIYGGGKMFEFCEAMGDIGAKNIEAAQSMLAAAGINVIERDVGGFVFRKIRFDVMSGAVEVSHGETDHVAGL